MVKIYGMSFINKFKMVIKNIVVKLVHMQYAVSGNDLCIGKITAPHCELFSDNNTQVCV